MNANLNGKLVVRTASGTTLIVGTVQGNGLRMISRDGANFGLNYTEPVVDVKGLEKGASVEAYVNNVCVYRSTPVVSIKNG